MCKTLHRLDDKFFVFGNPVQAVSVSAVITFVIESNPEPECQGPSVKLAFSVLFRLAF